MSKLTVTTISLFLLLFTLVSFSVTPVRAATNILFIVDASGSMKKKLDGKTRMSVAKDILSKTLKEMPSEANLGLLLYGHRRAKDCKDIELVAPIGSEDAAVLSKAILDINAKGETPIADALTKAAKSFKVFKGQQNKIILVTDGLEECRGDPCAAAKALKDSGLDVAVSIVGFTLGKEDAGKLQCVTKITGGTYYSASNAASLAKALKDVKKEVEETVIVQTAKKKSFNGDIVANKNGAKLEYAPSVKWINLNRNHESFVSKSRPTYSGEAVWSFKDGKSATFDKIEMMIPEKDKYNIKDFEILAADELNGSYRSLGEFTALNVKMRPAGWQGFKFPETTAYYVKVVFKNSFSSYVGGNAFRIMGSINEDSESKSTIKKDNGINVLANKNGAVIIYAPNNKWKNLNKKNPENFASKSRPTYSGEAVWSFKDGKSASFNKIKVMLNSSDKYNLKNFEVLSSDTLKGDYKSLGEFTTKNMRFMPDGWQHFKLPETTAYYVKVVFKDSFSSYVGGNAIELIGNINEDSSPIKQSKKLEGIDVIAKANGGSLLFSPNDEWDLLNNESRKRAIVRVGEAVWAFKDEKPATIKAVKIYYPSVNKYGIKDFEILVGDEGPTGKFRSVGKFKAHNALTFPDGWQAFNLPETKATYLKLKTISDQGGGYISMYGMQVIGKLEE